MRSKRLMARSVIAAVLFIGIVLVSWVIIRAPSYGGKGGAAPREPEPIVFAPSISYDRALRLLTDMGLQPSLEYMLVVETEKSLTSSLWKTQLYAQPGVLSVEVPYTSRC